MVANDAAAGDSAEGTVPIEPETTPDPKDPDAPKPLPPEPTIRTGDNTAEGRTQRLELYKLAVEMADRVSARRTGANNFFLALHAAFASVVTFVGLQTSSPSSGGGAPSSVDRFAMLIIAAVGVLLCVAWFLGLRSYRDLNSAKFKVISSLESQLPVHLFSDEWRYLREDKIVGWRGRYREQGSVERWVPMLFGIVYVSAFITSMAR